MKYLKLVLFRLKPSMFQVMVEKTLDEVRKDSEFSSDVEVSAASADLSEEYSLNAPFQG